MDRRSALLVAVILLLVGAIGLLLSAHFGLFARSAPAEWTELEAFNQIVLEVAGEVTVRQSDRYAVRVDAPPRGRARTEVAVEDDTLTIRNRPARISLSGQAVEPIRYLVEAADLQRADVGGMAIVRIESTEAERFVLIVRDAASVEIGAIQVDAIEAQLYGDGRVMLAGTSSDQSVSVSQRAIYDARDLRSETARIRIAGDGSAQVWVTEALDVDIAGGGSVAYRGRPSVTQQVVGSGQVVPLDARD